MNKRKQSGFQPAFTITPAIAQGLMRIEALKVAIQALPISARVLAHLRETARLFSTHCSTMIEGNRLTQEQVAGVIGDGRSFPGRERDQAEVKGYYAALDELERLARRKQAIAEATVKRLHALVVGGGKLRVRPSPYRGGQNVIRDSRSNAIVYLPPESHDVPLLMGQLIAWLDREKDWPAPVKAAIAHCQFATVHPYYDGNGRAACLFATLILHLGGYDLKGLYALEEYYARDLKGYYEALSLGPSHNYYQGRAEADITPWIAYFTAGMVESFERVHGQARREAARGGSDQSRLLRDLDARQRRALSLFQESREIASKDVGLLFGLMPRGAALLCQRWVESGFLEVTDPANKTRRYKLADLYASLVDAIH
jgi:Fic family protein